MIKLHFKRVQIQSDSVNILIFQSFCSFCRLWYEFHFTDFCPADQAELRLIFLPQHASETQKLYTECCRKPQTNVSGSLHLMVISYKTSDTSFSPLPARTVPPSDQVISFPHLKSCSGVINSIFHRHASMPWKMEF